MQPDVNLEKTTVMNAAMHALTVHCVLYSHMQSKLLHHQTATVNNTTSPTYLPPHWPPTASNVPTSITGLLIWPTEATPHSQMYTHRPTCKCILWSLCMTDRIMLFI